MTTIEFIHIREVPLSQFTRQARKLHGIATQAESYREQMSEFSCYEEEILLTEIAATGYELAAFLDAPVPAARLAALIEHLTDELVSYSEKIQNHTSDGEANS